MFSNKRLGPGLQCSPVSCLAMVLPIAMQILPFILSKDTIVIYLLVYVDDIILTGNNSESLTDLIKVLSSRFAMKDLGSLNYFLGLEV